MGLEHLPERGVLPLYNVGVDEISIVDFTQAHTLSTYYLDGRIIFMPREMSVIVDNNKRHLDPKEYTLFLLLRNHANVYIPREDIYEMLPRGNRHKKTEFDMVMRNLLNKVEPDPKNPQLIHKRREKGIRFGEFDPTKFFDSSTGEISLARQIPFAKGEVIYYPESKAVRVNENVAEFTTTESDIMHVLLKSARMLVTSREILEKVWSDVLLDKNNVDAYIKKLRDKVEPDPKNPKVINTIREKGYILGEYDKNKGNKIPLPGGKIILFPDVDMAAVGETDISLEPTMIMVLRSLLKGGDNPVTYESIIEDVWMGTGSISILRNYISQIRARLGNDLISTVPRVGYQLQATH